MMLFDGLSAKPETLPIGYWFLIQSFLYFRSDGKYFQRTTLLLSSNSDLITSVPGNVSFLGLLLCSALLYFSIQKKISDL